MRTTLTIDPQIASKLKEFIKKNDLSLKSAINELLKRGLSFDNKTTTPKKYSTNPRVLRRPILSEVKWKNPI